jgi:hypothetical protein
MKMLKNVCLLFIIMFVFECTGYADFQDNGKDTVADTETGLMWQKSNSALMTWGNALRYCENLTIGSYNDWRLPTIQELASLVDYDEYNPAIDKDYFPDTMSFHYWSSTTHVKFPFYARYVNFHGGLANSADRSKWKYVRAVRSGL